MLNTLYKCLFAYIMYIKGLYIMYLQVLWWNISTIMVVRVHICLPSATFHFDWWRKPTWSVMYKYIYIYTFSWLICIFALKCPNVAFSNILILQTKWPGYKVLPMSLLLKRNSCLRIFFIIHVPATIAQLFDTFVYNEWCLTDPILCSGWHNFHGIMTLEVLEHCNFPDYFVIPADLELICCT